MPVKVNPSMSPHDRKVVETRVDTKSPATLGVREAQFRQAWQNLIDQKLLAWLKNPSQLDDEGVEAPTGTILRLAIDMAEKFRDGEFPPPDSVVPDANGGIVFERSESAESEVIHFWEDGTVEFQQFRSTKLVDRREL